MKAFNVLLKIDRLEQIGRFAALKHKAPQFGKLSLVFARNALGKSTLCDVIRSAAVDEPRIIATRKRLGAATDPQVDLVWASVGSITYSRGAWNSSPSNVYVFDQEYVRQNLHVGEIVTRDNQRNLLPVVLGNAGVEIRNTISALDEEQRRIASDIAESERQIRTLHPSITQIPSYVETACPPDIDARITAAKIRLEAAKSAAAINAKADPITIAIPDIDAFITILGKGADVIAEDAQARVESHIRVHSMEEHGTRWLKYGVDHIKDDRCPFCTQDVSHINLVDIFKSYFSDAYLALSVDVDQALQLLRKVVGEDGHAVAKILESNRGDVAYWGTVCELSERPELSGEQLADVLSAYRLLTNWFEEKQRNPLARVLPLPSEIETVTSAIAVFAKYQGVLSRCIATIHELRRTAAAGLDSSSAQTTYDKLQALKAKSSPPMAELIATWASLAKRRSQIDTDKPKLHTQLRTAVSTALRNKQDGINDLLEQFGANFQIADTKASFVGREPNADYSIALGAHRVRIGDKSQDRPHFSTVLSSGDKFTLALAFFISQVRANSELPSSVVIFDDPFSSQDMDRQSETARHIRVLSDEAAQVIVFSHDPRFLELIAKNVHGTPSTFQLNCDDDGIGSLMSWSIADEIKELYVRQHERIREYANSGRLLPGATTDSLAKDLRTFLEDHLRARFPGRFERLVMLDAMALAVEESGVVDPYFKFVADLRAINEYSRDFMHAGAPPPVPAVLRMHCKRIIKIVGAY